MWLLVLFDLPTDTKKERSAATKFIKELLNDGFNMFQFSVYLRHCPSIENLEVHYRRIKRALPEYGYVAYIQITDKQYEKLEIFQAKKIINKPNTPQQLEMF